MRSHDAAAVRKGATLDNPISPKPEANSQDIFLLLICVLLVAVFFIYKRQTPSQDENVMPVVMQDTVASAVVAENLEDIVKKLEGRWQRTDGGYIIELKNPRPDGKIEASYFNPNPIHVGRAGWQNNAGKIIVTVELQDVNYPGSVYTLEYINAEDPIEGQLFPGSGKSKLRSGFYAGRVK